MPSDEQFTEVFESTRQTLVRLSARYLGSLEDAEDNVQEAYLKAWRNRASYRGESRIGTWLGRIVINEALMRLRQRRAQKSYRTMVVDTEGKLSEQLPSDGPSAFRLARSNQVLAEISQLAEDSANVQAVLLLDYEGHLGREVAQMLGESLNTVKARAFRGRRELRKTLS